MADYAIINLLSVDDSVAGRAEGLEGRFGRKHLDSRDLGVSHFRYEPGVRGVNHRHKAQEEAYVVISGSGRVRLDDEVRDVGPCDGDGVIDDAPWPGRG